LWYNEDIREDDRGVDEAFIALDGLEREGGCDFGAAAAFEKVVLAFCLMVFGQVASSYAL
jgi:hypothetical protein